MAIPPRRLARFLILLLTLGVIVTFAWSMRPATIDRGAVVRVSLDAVPEERVVEFGHAAPLPRMVPPVGEIRDVVESTVSSVEDQPPAQLAKVQVSTKTEPPAPAKLQPDKNGILPISYKLSEGVSSQQGGVGVPKTIASHHGAAADLTIFLLGGSVIEIDREELVAALGQLGAADQAEKLPPSESSGRLSLDRVRMAGLNVRYDAIHDRLVLQP